MATIKNGINGGFKGRVGNVVGYQLNGQWVIRSLPQVSQKMKVGTAKQQQYRVRFAALQSFLKKMLPFIKIGFKESALKLNLNPHNVAVSRNLPHVNDLGQIQLDAVVLSQGTLPNSPEQTLLLENGHLQILWNPSVLEDSASADDFIMLIAYNPINNYVVMDLAAAKRKAGLCIIAMAGEAGDTYHIWTSFVSYPAGITSASVYLGTVHI